MLLGPYLLFSLKLRFLNWKQRSSVWLDCYPLHRRIHAGIRQVAMDTAYRRTLLRRFVWKHKTASIWCHNLVFHPIYSTILEWLWCNRYFYVTNCLQKYSVCMSLSYADLKRTLKSAIHIRKAKKIRSFMKIVLTFFISLLLLKL